MPTLIYNYGAKQPTQGLQNILDQLLLAHRYRNALVTVELERREQLRKLQLEMFPELEAVEAEVKKYDELIREERNKINQERIKTHKRITKTPTSGKIKEYASVRNELYGRLKSMRQQMNGVRDREAEKEANQGVGNYEKKKVIWKNPPNPQWAEVRDKINAEANEKRKALNTSQEFNSDRLSWGTKGRLNETVDITDPAPPKRKSWVDNGCTGRIAVQIQSGNPLTTGELFGDDTRVRLTPVNWEAKPRQRKSTLSLRIGSVPGTNNPIWATVPVLLHRPLPEGQVKWVWLLRRKVGPTYNWYVQITVNTDRSEHEGKGTVGIDDGWRKLPEDYHRGEGIRVAAWASDDGKEGELILPMHKVHEWNKIKKLQGRRADNFNVVKATLLKFISTNKVPDWFGEALKDLDKWRSQQRLYDFIGNHKAFPKPSQALWDKPDPPTWNNNRFPGDEEVFAKCCSWATQDRMNYDAERHMEYNLTKWRGTFFRTYIEEHLSGFALAKVEDTDRAEMQKNPNPEESDEISKYYRKVASPGRFIEMVKESLPTKKVDPSHTTDTCSVCGEITNTKHKDLMIECEHCGAVWDRDFNAALNILRG